MARFLLGCGSAVDGQLGATDVDCLTPRPLAGFPADPPRSFAAGPLGTIVVTPDAVLASRAPHNDGRPASPQPLPAPHSGGKGGKGNGGNGNGGNGNGGNGNGGAAPHSLAAAAAGRDFALLLSTSGALYSYGTGAFGELGLRSTRSAPAPTLVDALASVKVVAVAAAEFHWLCLDALGAVFACGNNRHGQLGLAHNNPVSIPTRVTALWPHPIVAVATGDAHSAVLSATGHAFCFGSNKHGQLGSSQFRVRVASLLPSLVPTPQPDRLAPARDDASPASSLPSSSPDPRAPSELPKSQSTRQQHDADADAMEIDSSPAASFDPAHPHRNVPPPDDPAAHAAETYVDIACGSAHTVALRSDGAILCWGSGDHGQLGSRAQRSLYQPTVAHAAGRFVAVAAGQRHSGAVTADGIAYLWGDGTSGQLGDGDASEKFVPIALPTPRVPQQTASGGGPLRYARLQCGGYHSLFLAADHSVPVFDAAVAHASRIPRCVVDNMLQPKAGLARFGSATVLLRSFVRPNIKHYSVHKVDYVAAETAHLKFLHMFGEEGKKVLAQAAARIRHQAQVAFGLVRGDNMAVFGVDDVDRSLITPKGQLVKEEESFRRSVANCAEVGYLFFIALMNPIYSESANVTHLSELAAILLQCEESAREAFIELVAEAEEGVLLNRLIKPLQGVLNDELRGYRRVTRNVIFATKMLALCYHGVWRASRRKNLRGLSVSRKEFYNDTVSEMVNLEEDYDRWVQGKNNNLNRPDAMDGDSGVDDAIGQGQGYSTLELSELPPLPVSGRDDGLFAFCSYSFLLTEAAKFRILEYESQTTMSEESLRSVLSFGTMQMPFGRVSHIHLPAEHAAHLQFLVLHVRRNHIVSDVYLQVGELAKKHPRALRKPLKVMFDGEDGVDEGGVRKEFFQVLMEHIMSPDYGMFEYDDETQFHWLRKDFLEPELSWTLIGIIFGLAAFNSILLDVQFPPVMYRKLARAVRCAQLRIGPDAGNEGDNVQGGERGHDQAAQDMDDMDELREQEDYARQASGGGGGGGGGGRGRKRPKQQYRAELEDVKEAFPSIGNSLQQLRDYEGEDVEDIFCLTFEISYRGLFDKVVNVELKPNGGSIPVTSENREEFIALYTDYLINGSIERAFQPFAAGFSFMVDGPFVTQLTADELETLVIGEKELDFGGLRNAARYEGYDEKSTVIVNLWQVLDEFNEELKRLFLSFVTGTDRAPIGGLHKLVLVIQRAEGDSNRLPTSHTCFNVLLLPEYKTRAKLRDRLLTAIRNSKGFGLR